MGKGKRLRSEWMRRLSEVLEMFISCPEYLWIYFYLIDNHIEIIVNAYVFVRNNAEKSHVPLSQFSRTCHLAK